MCLATSVFLIARPQETGSRRTQVVLLGTGTPRPLPHRFGPSTAVVVDDTPYLVDFGPGVVRRAAAAAENGIAGLAVNRLETAFVTHLHSDHTVGYPDLIFTPWVMGRSRLRVYGPKGIAAMTEHLLAAWKIDIDIRTGGEGARQRVSVETHEIEAGLVYQDAQCDGDCLPGSTRGRAERIWLRAKDARPNDRDFRRYEPEPCAGRGLPAVRCPHP